jgi:hypothetical protein
MPPRANEITRKIRRYTCDEYEYLPSIISSCMPSEMKRKPKFLSRIWNPPNQRQFTECAPYISKGVPWNGKGKIKNHTAQQTRTYANAD